MSAFYLAARYGRRVELQEYASDLVRRGHIVTSRWLAGVDAATETASIDGGVLGPEFRPAVRRMNAEDVEDIEAADTLILFTDPDKTRGGKHFETGYAYALGKHIVVVGEPELTFHFLPEILRAPTWEAALDRIA